MRSGLYALASLDGSPLAEEGLVELGIRDPAGCDARHEGGFAVRAVDAEEDGRAAHVGTRGDCVAAFLGHLDEVEDLAALLSISPAMPTLDLALAALARFGDDAPGRMPGEWSLLRWHPQSRELTLLCSEACRDPMFVATDGKRVAVSPDIRSLARLDWVDDTIDPRGLFLQWSRARLRRIMTGETFLRGVRRVAPGTRETFAPGRRRTSNASGPLPPEPWQGSFEDAVAALEGVARRIVGQHLDRHRAAAFLLSGGLDSSLLAWLGVQERRHDQPMFCLTSVAPEGSGIGDERAFSSAVANRLGIPVTFLCPPDDASVYTPSARTFAHQQMSVASPRHYLYDALSDAALAQGANALFDGAYGEMSLTNKLPPAGTGNAARRHLRNVRAWLDGTRGGQDWPANAFHVRLSKQALAGLPSEWRDAWREPHAVHATPRPAEPWGFRPAVAKNAMTPTSSASGRLRHLIPFRDRRLLRLAASMPTHFFHRDGVNRALARAMLKDRLQDDVRMRQGGGAFSPDYMQRIRRHAPMALARIELYEASGAGAWLDLDWLAHKLADARAGCVTGTSEALSLQATAVAAEFFVWWRSQI